MPIGGGKAKYTKSHEDEEDDVHGKDEDASAIEVRTNASLLAGGSEQEPAPACPRGKLARCLREKRKRRGLCCCTLCSVVLLVLYSLGLLSSDAKRNFDLNWSQVQHGRMAKQLRLFLFQSARETEADAKSYFEAQWPHIRESARTMSLARPWAASAPYMEAGSSWYQLLTMRAKAQKLNYDTQRWVDYQVEKDRCAMAIFIEKNGFPSCSLAAMWDSYEHHTLEEGLASLFAQTTEWPLIFKMCHITMGGYKAAWAVFDSSEGDQSGSMGNERLGYTPTKSAQATLRKVDEFWYIHGTDADRPWRDYFDPLTDLVRPGVMVQRPFAGKTRPAELKIEVLWGRAYLGIITENGIDWGKCDERDGLVLRDTDVVRNINEFTWETTHHECNEWIIKEGHLKYAWHLAEGFAKAAMIDAVRVDVFLHPGHPELAMINEISLTTGHFYNAHHHYMAQAWQQGHQAKEYETVDLGRSTHLHFRGPDWFARNYSNCDASVLHPKLLEMWC
ncbi:hypothetical protein AB1Y20_009196 [Prymnesium parvum]|uniref:Phospholipase B-like n=1 Tax=Prymnesium parvum TaxID=97485 RepID=A0AB34K3N4_PRYPA